MPCKSPKTSQRPQKPSQGDQLIHRRYTKSSPQYPNFSFRFGARSKSAKVKLGKQRGATVAVCDDGGRVMVKEWNRDREMSRLRLLTCYLLAQCNSIPAIRKTFTLIHFILNFINHHHV